MLVNRPESVLNASRSNSASGHTETVSGPSLLVLEDEPRLRDVLVRSLCAEGFDAHGVGTAHELLARVPTTRPDALVIDIGLPDADGRDVCQALRARGIHTPVLFLTARDALTDRLAGFNAGGDDYVTKPFDIEEVAARLHVLVRRAGGGSEPAVAGLVLDPTERSASQDGTQLSLTPTEFRLLAALAARHGKACTRAQLIAAAWPFGAIVHDNTLDVYIWRLRRKLRTLPDPPELATVHGTGYRLG
jgi:two-component system, OmpR family, response regulator